MTTFEEDKLQPIFQNIGYYDQQILSVYRDQPDKYIFKNDYFYGELSTTREYYIELEQNEKSHESINIRFGYRTLKDGNLAVVVWLPDLYGYRGKKFNSPHIPKWNGFCLQKPEWTNNHDERFENWVKRCIDASCEVDNGPSHYIEETIKIINGLTNEVVYRSLYEYEPNEAIMYPSAENSYRYQDAHKDLYGYLIDGLNKDCLKAINTHLAISVQRLDNMNTITGIKNLFPELNEPSDFHDAMELVSEQRRLATHRVRPPAISFPAFDTFKQDLSACLKALQQVLKVLEEKFNMDGEKAYERYHARQYLPKIIAPSNTHVLLEISKMQGKTIEKIDYGISEEIAGCHQSEALLIYFTDGSIIGIDTGSNAADLADKHPDLRPEDVHADFLVHWVPELPDNKTNE